MPVTASIVDGQRRRAAVSDSPLKVLLAGHYLTDTDRCVCGAAGDAFIEHAAEIAAIGAGEAAELVEELHSTEVLNAGCCGGCESCGNRSESYRCQVCGESSGQCVTSYVAGLFLRPPSTENTEGLSWE